MQLPYAQFERRNFSAVDFRAVTNTTLNDYSTSQVHNVHTHYAN